MKGGSSPSYDDVDKVASLPIVLDLLIQTMLLLQQKISGSRGKGAGMPFATESYLISLGR
jgi:hypothetical protein